MIRCICKFLLPKGVRFGIKGMLSPHCVGPYEIMLKVGMFTYELKLPKDLALVYPIFPCFNA